jgi:hypothetical protein
MYIRLLDLKDEMVRNGEYLMDFSENNFEVNYGHPNLIIQKIFIIEEKHLCRPDLLSWEAYSSVDYIDAILKFNQICNPFSIDLDDIIVIPTLNSLNYFYKKSKKSAQQVKDTKALFLDPTRASQKDINRINQLAKIASKRKNGSSSPKPTNLLRPGEVPFSTDGKVLRFAPSISSPRFPTNP